MHICKTHWDALRTAVIEKGMGQLIPANHKEVIDSLMNGISESPGNFDPLLRAFLMICEASLKMGNLYMMHNKEDGTHYCPLCEAEKHAGEGTASRWIEGCATAQAVYCRENGLIHPIQ